MAQTQNPPADAVDIDEAQTEATDEAQTEATDEAQTEATDEAPAVEWTEGVETSELQLRKPRNLDVDAANAMLAAVQAKGYNDDGISKATVGNGKLYATHAEAEEAAKAPRNLLQRVAPAGENAGVAYVDSPEGTKFYLYLKPKGEPRAAKTSK